MKARVQLMRGRRIFPLLRFSLMASVLFAGASPALAQGFVNQSFEELSPGQFVNGGDDKMTVTAAPGWSINSGSPDWMYGPGVSLWDTNWGNYFQLAGSFDPAAGIGASLPAGGFGILREGVGQSVSGFTPGSSYRISFHHTNGFIETPLVPPPPGGWELFIDNTSVDLALSTNIFGPFFPLPHTATDWQLSSHVFQATSSTHQFDFVAYKSSSNLGAAIQWLDNVTITQIPEPGTVFLACLGTVAILANRKLSVTHPT